MNLVINAKQPLKDGRQAFSLVEALVGFTIITIFFVGLFLGLSQGFATLQRSRENSRATQILLEKMETIRLYSWSQINSNGFIPHNFVVAYDYKNTSGSGFYFTGTLTVASAPVSANYSNDMRLLTVELDWQSRDTNRHREMSTLISQYGIQNYFF